MRVRDVIFVLLVTAVCAFFVTRTLVQSSENDIDTEVGPTHKEINYPVNARPLGLQCGDKPCAIFADPNSGAIIALMLDGSTITIKPEEAEESNY